jgi:hypothetical protein
MGYIGGITAATTAAAAEKRRRMLRAEEEDMTQYTQDDLRDDWEFKIVRSETGAFRRPEVLERLIEKEAQAGWVMVEKFDDMRVRFKRSRSARASDAYLPQGVDPYRTHYGTSFARPAVILGLVLMLGLAAAGAFVAFEVQGGAPMPEPDVFGGPIIWALVTLFGIVALLVGLVKWRRR